MAGPSTARMTLSQETTNVAQGIAHGPLMACLGNVQRIVRRQFQQQFQPPEQRIITVEHNQIQITHSGDEWSGGWDKIDGEVT
jgi:hypothetical protein